MSRRRGGVLGRTVQASVKITAVEQQILRDKYGGVPRGLRAGLDLLLHAEPGTEQPGVTRSSSKKRRQTRPVAEPPMPPPEVLAQMDPLVPPPDGLDAEEAASADPWASVRPDAAAGAAPHRHKRGEKLNEVFEHGTPIRTYRCAVPGCTTTLTA